MWQLQDGVPRSPIPALQPEEPANVKPVKLEKQGKDAGIGEVGSRGGRMVRGGVGDILGLDHLNQGMEFF